MKPISPWFQTAALMTQSVMRSAIWRPHGKIGRPTCSRGPDWNWSFRARAETEKITT